MLIHEWVSVATSQLTGAGIGTAKLDAELILSHTLKKSRTYLHAYRDEPLSPRQREIADARLDLRIDRVPLAYITGHKEFYGRAFKVSPAVLIPRPESEAVIELLKRIDERGNDPLRLVDVGTGSGCLGITAKLERPHLNVTLIDISQHALTIAGENARRHHADVYIQKSDLLHRHAAAADIYLANLPYVDRSWKRSPETEHEPRLALFADDQGMHLIRKLLRQLPTSKKVDLIIEADPVQHTALTDYASERGFRRVDHLDYAVAFTRN